MQIFARFLAVHSPREVGVCAESLLIGEIAPAPDALTDEKAHAAKIKQISYVDALDKAHDKRRKHSADKSAVNGKTAVPHRNYLGRMRRIISPLVENVVKTCSDDAEQCAPNKDIEHFIYVNFP